MCTILDGTGWDKLRSGRRRQAGGFVSLCECMRLAHRMASITGIGPASVHEPALHWLCRKQKRFDLVLDPGLDFRFEWRSGRRGVILGHLAISRTEVHVVDDGAKVHFQGFVLGQQRQEEFGDSSGIGAPAHSKSISTRFTPLAKIASRLQAYLCRSHPDDLTPRDRSDGCLISACHSSRSSKAIRYRTGRRGPMAPRNWSIRALWKSGHKPDRSKYGFMPGKGGLSNCMFIDFVPCG